MTMRWARWCGWILAVAAASAMLAVLNPGIVESADRSITPVILQGRAWIYSQLQTFSGRIAVSGTGTDLTIATGTNAPTIAQGLTTGAFCSSANQYRAVVVWIGTSGASDPTPASSPDLTPSSTTSSIAVTRPTAPTNATGWQAYILSSADGFATKNSCGTVGNLPAVVTPISRTTAQCYCPSTVETAPASNSTHALTPLSISGDAFSLPEWRTVTVCPTGNCQYSTITAALNSITDASSSRMYVVKIYPGDYRENVTMKNRVFLDGINRDTVRIIGINSGGGLDIGNTAYYSGISNLTVGGQKPLEAHGTPPTIQAQFFVSNCVLGINDSTVNFQAPDTNELSIDGVLDEMGNRDWFVSNSLYRTVFDNVVVTSGTNYYGVGNTLYCSDKYVPASQAKQLWRHNGGGTVSESGFFARVESTFTTSGTTVAGVLGSSSFNTDGATYRIGPGTIYLSAADSGSSTLACVYLAANSTLPNPTKIEMTGVNCIVDGLSSGRSANGVKVDLDTDHSNITVNWRGGSIVTTGGASQFDVNNAETTVGFSLNFYGTVMAGTHNGAGTENYVDAVLTNGVSRNTPIASCPSACNRGDTCWNTSPAFCGCTTTGAPGTWTKIIGAGSCP